jgi:lysophospholipase L1-like esterase
MTMNWHTLADKDIEFQGLPWLSSNGSNLWRLPAATLGNLPEGVRRQAIFPAGARIRLATDSPSLSFRGCSVSGDSRQAVDIYVEGAFLKSVGVNQPAESEIIIIEDLPRQFRDIELYLPYRHEIRVGAVGIDAHAQLRKPASYSKDLPFVLYGSSVAQGASAARAGMAYPSILGRMLNLDFVNLGFGGAGKAEPEVVELVASIGASCFLFDLGKSYGRQDASAYTAMLETVRARHAEIPLVCITPVFSTRETFEPDYEELSLHTREITRQAVAERTETGDPNIILIEGTDLLGSEDTDGFSGDGVHPNDLGFNLMAERLEKRLAGIFGDRKLR